MLESEDNLKITTKKLVALVSTKNDVIRVIDEVGITIFPCVYILIGDTEKIKVYVGETSDARSRIQEHRNFPPLEWKRCILIWDGKPQNISIFSYDWLRKQLEFELKDLLSSYFEVISKAYSVELENRYKVRTVQDIFDETVFLLYRLGIIKHENFEKRLELGKGLKMEKIQLERLLEDEIPIDKIVNKIEAFGLTVEELTRSERRFKLGEKVCFYRPGSPKPRGYQVTIRGTFLKHFNEGEGFLLVNRGKGYIIPLKELKKKFGKFLEEGQDTLDIFFNLTDEEVICHEEKLSLSQFRMEEMLQKIKQIQ